MLATRPPLLRLLLALLGLTLVAGACSSDDGSADATSGDDGTEASAPETIRIGTFSRAVDYAPFYIAQAEGMFEAAADGAEIEYVEFNSAPAINEALGTGRIDMVFMAEPPALITASAGIDVIIAALGASLIQDIVVPAGSDIETAEDLGGARVGVLAGSSSQYGLLSIAEDAGVDPDSIEILDLAPPDAQAAFEAGEFDAWAVWPPFVQQQVIQETGVLLPEGDAAIQSIVVVPTSFAEEYPETYAALVQAVADAKEFIAENEADAQAIVSEAVSVDAEVVELAWPRHDFTAEIDDDVVADIQEKADFLVEAGFLENEVDVATLVEQRG